MTCPDMIFSVLYIGNVNMIRDAVTYLVNAKHCEWDLNSINECSLDQLRVAFFLLMDRDIDFKQQLLQGWSNINVGPLQPGKAEQFFEYLKEDVIDQWLVDERLTCSWFIEKVTELYLIS